MSGDPVLWTAEDPEGAAAQVGGRPVHVWWSRLRGAFRSVLLEPHRRAGGGMVGWRWRAPTHAPQASAADLAVLRRRLGGALLDFADELERADSGPGDLHAAMQSVVEGLVRLSDTQLSAYVVPTEQGWMIRSWGFAQPSAAVAEDSDETIPAAALPAESDVVVPKQSTSTGKKRLGWVIVAVAVVALMLIAAWHLRDARPTAESLIAERTEEITTPRAQEKPSAKKITGDDLPAQVGRAEMNRSTAGNTAGFPAIPGQAKAGVAGGLFATDLVAAAVPAAFTGVMPVSAEAKGERAGPKSHLAGEPQPEITLARPDGAENESNPLPKTARTKGDTKAPPQGAGAMEARTEAEKNDTKFNAAANGIPSPARDASPRATPSDGEGSEVEARKHFTKEARMAPEAGKPLAHPESLEVDAGAGDLSEAGNPANVVRRTAQQTDAETAVTSRRLAGAPVEFPVKVTAGAWRVVRVRDVILETWPAERSAEDDALKGARAKALAVARAEMPVSFRSPIIRQGWRLRLAPAAWLPAPPVWRDATTGTTLAEREADLLSGWTAVEIAPGMDARLVAADGREYATVVASNDGRSASLHGAPEVLAAVPWVGLDAAAGETKASGWAWRSLSAGWSDASWETVRDEHGVSVRCVSEPGGKTGGILAVMDDVSGWALACEWSEEVTAKRR